MSCIPAYAESTEILGVIKRYGLHIMEALVPAGPLRWRSPHTLHASETVIKSILHTSLHQYITYKGLFALPEWSSTHLDAPASEEPMLAWLSIFDTGRLRIERGHAAMRKRSGQGPVAGSWIDRGGQLVPSAAFGTLMWRETLNRCAVVH